MIRVFITGGTLDKEYDELQGELYLPRNHLEDLIKQARCTLPMKTQQLMLKDSLDISISDREHIKQACLAAEEDKVIITHGTDTMVDTAQHIAAGIKQKTVVMLGAMRPFSLGNSDALFNLGCAISAVQLLDAGVYITMNGKIFSWDKVKKNKQAGCFETL